MSSDVDHVILLLSDLHFGRENDAAGVSERALALERLLETVCGFTQPWRPDVICIAGDLAHRGAHSDYKEALVWVNSLLARLDLLPDALFMCPGNHDVDRRSAHPRPHDADAADSPFRSCKPVEMAAPFAEFERFCDDAGVPPYRFGTGTSHLVGTRVRDSLSVTAYNSAWFSRDGHDTGHLWLGLPYLRHMEHAGQLVRCSLDEDDRVSVALMHHPPWWLAKAELEPGPGRPATFECIAGFSDFVFTGHAHGGGILKASLRAERAWHLGTGASYESIRYENAFRIIRISGTRWSYRTYQFEPRSSGRDWVLLHEQELELRGGRAQRQPARVAELGLSAHVLQSVDSPNLRMRPPALELVPPSPVAHLGRRGATVQRISDDIAATAWVHLTGSVGSGKTQLGLLAADACAGADAWLRLRGLAPEEAAHRVEWATTSGVLVSSADARGDRRGLVVIDDLPRMTGADALCDAMVRLAGECKSRDIRLLTLGHHPLPSTISDSLGDSSVTMLGVPRLDDTEATEVLSALGAPESIANTHVAHFLNRLSHGDPSLLVAAARHVRAASWELDEKSVTRLLAGAHEKSVADEAIGRLLSGVEKPASRELLYRCDVSLLPLTIDDVSALASVEPSVTRPRERLYELDGLWVEHSSPGSYSVAPLAHVASRGALNEETLVGCHGVLVERLMALGSLGPMEVVAGICHMRGARDDDSAGALLFKALDELRHVSPSVPDYGLTSLWSEAPLPAGMSRGLRIAVRAMQVVARSYRGLSVEYTANDLDLLAASATTSEAWAVVLAAATAGPTLAASARQIGGRCVQRALALSSDGLALDGSPLELPEGLLVEDLVWGMTGELSSAADVREWLTTIESLTPEQRIRAFAGEAGEEGSHVVPGQLWTSEHSKSPAARDWPAVLVLLAEMAERSRAAELELLWAGVQRARTVVLGEYMGRLGQARDLVDDSLAHVSDDPRVEFLLCDAMGRQYLYAKERKNALTWFTRALSADTPAFPLMRVNTLMYASTASSDGDPRLAVELSCRAAALAKDAQRVPDRTVVAALGELAIAQWFLGDSRAAFLAWEEAVEALLRMRDDSRHWKERFVLCGHISGFFHIVASGRKLSDFAVDGDEYSPPFSGIFDTQVEARAELFQPAAVPLIYTQVAGFASAVGEAERAAEWGRLGVGAARETNLAAGIAAAADHYIPQLVVSHRYLEAFDLSLEGSRCYAAVASRGDTSSTGILGVKESVVLDKADPQLRRDSEADALYFGVLVVALGVLRELLESPSDGREKVLEVAREYDEYARTAAAPGLWQAAAALMELAASAEREPGSADDVTAALEGTPNSALQMVAHLVESTGPGIGLARALEHQLQVFGFFTRTGDRLSTAYRLVALPFLEMYWARSIEDSAFLFKTPPLTRQEVEAARAAPPERRAQELLLAVGRGLGVRFGGEAGAWVRGVADSEPSVE